MIVGVGIDVVEIDRFAETLESSPGMRERLFTPLERDLHVRSLAARFARSLAADPAYEVIGVDLTPPRHDLGRARAVGNLQGRDPAQERRRLGRVVRGEGPGAEIGVAQGDPTRGFVQSGGHC